MIMGNPNPVPRPENLKPWKPGETGNPKGRPPSKPMKAALDAASDADPCLLSDLISVGIREAKNGDFRYWKEIWDRFDGKPVSAEPEAEAVDGYDESESDDELDGTDSQRVRQVLEGGKPTINVGARPPAIDGGSPETGAKR